MWNRKANGTTLRNRIRWGGWSGRPGALPGWGGALGLSLLFLGGILLLPMLALAWRLLHLEPEAWARTLGDARVIASLWLTLGCAAAATVLTTLVGGLFAWVLARHRFPGRRLLDAMIDLPFALPTAVAGIALTALLAGNGWVGRCLSPLGLEIVYRPAGIVLAMAFTCLPYVVRTVQGVLEDLDPSMEDAATSLGAGRGRVFFSVIVPQIRPALAVGAMLGFARALGEFGAVIFIAGNRPFQTEVATLLLYIRLEEYDYDAASILAGLLLLCSGIALAIASALGHWSLGQGEAESTAQQSPRRIAPGNWMQWALVALAGLVAGVCLGLPLALVFSQALANGPGQLWAELQTRDCLHALGLTLLTAGLALGINLVFGIFACWWLGKYRFFGRRLAFILMCLPATLSPVVIGVAHLMLYGSRGWFGPWLMEHGWEIAYAVPGVVLVTTYITFPYILSQVVPLMEHQGRDAESTAASLGAGFWPILGRITLPAVRWGLFYGAILATARAIGEYGAVSIMSGHIRNQTNTLALHIETLYHDYHGHGAFAGSALLTTLGLLTLVLKWWMERQAAKALTVPGTQKPE